MTDRLCAVLGKQFHPDPKLSDRGFHPRNMLGRVVGHAAGGHTDARKKRRGYVWRCDMSNVTDGRMPATLARPA